ncbi:UNVERIFIED_CONTAM: hypothetical protein RMT77_019802 [Armadillidium vulgare]
MTDKFTPKSDDSQTTYTNKSFEVTETETDFSKPEEAQIDRGASTEEVEDNKKSSKVKYSRDVPKTASQAFELLLNNVGSYHRYQWWLSLVCGVIHIFTGAHNMSAVFLAATPNHRCQIPSLQNETKYFTNSSLILYNISIPW